MIRSARAGRRLVRSSVPVIGHRADGSPIYGIAGGAADDADDGDDDDDAGSGDEEDEDDDDEDDDDSSSKSGDDSSDDDDDEDDDEDLSPKEKELQRKVRKLSRENAKWRNRVRKLEKGSKGKKGDKDDEEVAELRTKAQRAEELETDNVALSVQLAVLTTPEASQFVDPEDVLKFLDVDDLTDEDGGIDKEAVSDALEELAEKKPHLVKSSKGTKDDDEDGDEDGDGKSKKGGGKKPSGRQTNRKRGQKDTLTRESLAKKYPALRQR